METVNIADLLDGEAVHLDADIRRRRDLMDFLGHEAALRSGNSAETCRKALLAREKLGTTSLSNGVAFPHGQVDGLAAPVAVFVRLAEPIDYGTSGQRPVDLVVALLMPTDMAEAHLGYVASLAKQLRASGTVERLRTAQTVEDILDAFKP